MSQHECPSCGQVHKEKATPLKARVEMLEEKVRSLEARLPQWSYTTPHIYGNTSTFLNETTTGLVES